MSKNLVGLQKYSKYYFKCDCFEFNYFQSYQVFALDINVRVHLGLPITSQHCRCFAFTQSPSIERWQHFQVGRYCKYTLWWRIKSAQRTIITQQNMNMFQRTLAGRCASLSWFSVRERHPEILWDKSKCNTNGFEGSRIRGLLVYQLLHFASKFSRPRLLQSPYRCMLN